MNETKNVDKAMVTGSVIKKIRVDWNPSLIKAQHVTGFSDPDTIYVKGSKRRKGYKPDIIASNDDQLNIYEIELDQQMQVEKWVLFSDYASAHNGDLYIVVPDYLREHVKKEVREMNIFPRLIYFETR